MYSARSEKSKSGVGSTRIRGFRSPKVFTPFRDFHAPFVVFAFQKFSPVYP